MIEAILKFAGAYRLGGVKDVQGRQGMGWSATIFRDGVIVGEAADFADGGAARIYMKNKEEEALMLAHAKVAKPSAEYEIDCAFLESLVNYELSVKRLKTLAKKAIIGVKGKEFDENGVDEGYLSWKCEDTAANRLQVLKREPNIKIINDSLNQWEVLKAPKRQIVG